MYFCCDLFSEHSSAEFICVWQQFSKRAGLYSFFLTFHVFRFVQSLLLFSQSDSPSSSSWFCHPHTSTQPSFISINNCSADPRRHKQFASTQTLYGLLLCSSSPNSQLQQQQLTVEGSYLLCAN